MEIQNKQSEMAGDHFIEWCLEHLHEVENDTVDKAYERFCEEQQGQEINYIW